MNTQRVPRIRPRKDHREIKWLVTFYIDEADQVQAKDGEWFVPVKVEVKNWPRLGRAYVTVTGTSRRPSQRFRGYPGVANFNLKGSPQYPACPEWLKPLIKEAMQNERAEEIKYIRLQNYDVLGICHVIVEFINGSSACSCGNERGVTPNLRRE